MSSFECDLWYRYPLQFLALCLNSSTSASSLEFCARFTLCMINCLWKLMFAYKAPERRQVKSDKSTEREGVRERDSEYLQHLSSFVIYRLRCN